MKRLMFILVMLFSMTGIGFAVDKAPLFVGIPSLEKQEENYFVTGKGDHKTKFQLSIKSELYENSGIYVGYTETALWDTNKESAPFYDYNHSPSVFYQLNSKRNLFNLDLQAIDFISGGVRHKSNGQSGSFNRSINYYYADSQISSGGDYSFGIYVKYFRLFKVADSNNDFSDYSGTSEIKLFFDSVYFGAYGKAGIAFKKSNADYLLTIGKMKIPWYEIGVTINPFKMSTKLFFQYFKGYDECMMDYKKNSWSIRGGLTI
jgi:outer membrane phospholipase A